MAVLEKHVCFPQYVVFYLVLRDLGLSSFIFGDARHINTHTDSHNKQKALFKDQDFKKFDVLRILTGVKPTFQSKHSHVYKDQNSSETGRLSHTNENHHMDYEGFYAHDVSSVIPSQEIVDDFYTAVKWYNEQQQIRNDQIRHSENIPLEVSIIDRLWYALREGVLPLEETAFLKQSTTSTWNQASIIKSLVGPGSIVEVGTGATILHLAKLFNNVTCVGAITTGEQVRVVVRATRKEGLSNMYVTDSGPEQLSKAVETLYYDPQVLFGNLLVTNLTSLASGSLPHEFEELLGRLLSLAQKSFIIGLYPDDTNRAYFEQSWLSVTDLLQRACRVGGLKCGVREVTWSAGTGRPGWTRLQVLEVRVKHGVRLLEDATCHLRRPNTQCEIHFGENVEKTSILFSDNTKEDNVPPLDAIPFHVLFSLGASDNTRAQMFLGALDLPYSAERCTTSLAVMGSNIRNDFPKWSDDESCDDHQSQIQDSNDEDKEQLKAQDLNTMLKLQNRESVRGNDRSSRAHNNIYASHLSYKSLSPGNTKQMLQQEDSDKHRAGGPDGPEKIDTVADSQVDGVARGWNRVESKNPTQVRQDEQQYQSMGKHWDRENMDTLRQDPLQDQEKKELAKFDQAWDRELPQSEKKGTVGRSQQRKNEDSVLRRDEKELRKAMGFLHGETDVKGMEILLKQQRHHPARVVPLQHHGEGQKLSTVTATPRPRSTSTTFSSSHFLSRPGRKSSTHPQRARLAVSGKFNKGVIDARLKFQPLPKPQVRGEHKILRPGNSFVENDELERILRDDSAEQTKQKEDSAQVKRQKAASKIQPKVRDVAEDVEEALDGFEEGQDYGGVDKSKPADEKLHDKADYDSESDWNLPQLGAVADTFHHVQPAIIGKDERVAKQRNIEEEAKHALKEIVRADDHLAQADKVKVMQDTEGQLEDGDIPGDQEMDDEHLYEEVKMNYGVPYKNKRRLLAKDSSEVGLGADLMDVFNGIPGKFKQKLQNAVKAKARARGKISKDGAKGFYKPTEDATRSPGQKEEMILFQSVKPTAMESIGAGPGEDGKPLDGKEPTEESRSREKPKQTHTPEILTFRGRNFGPNDQEEALFDHQWRQISPRMRDDLGSTRHPFNVITYGSRSQSLLGLKIARTYPSAHALCLMPTRGAQIAERQRKVVESVGADNIVLLTVDLTPALVDTLSRSPDLARYQILGIEVYEWLLQLRLGFPFYLGRLLSLSTTSFLEVPQPEQLDLLLSYFRQTSPRAEDSEHAAFKGVVREALRLVNAESSSLTLLTDRHLRSHSHIQVLQVQIHAMKRPVQVDCGTGMAYLSLQAVGGVHRTGHGGVQKATHGATHLTGHASHAEVRLERAERTFSLHLLLEAGLREQPVERRRLFSWYLRQSLHQDMCPLHIIWHNSSLVYRPLFSSTMPLSMALQHTRAYHVQATMKAIQREIHGEPFSLLEYGSRSPELLLGLAQRYPSSSFLSVVDNDASLAATIHQRVTSSGAENVVVLNTTLDEKLAAKLLHSPEFLRYQFIELETFLRQVHDRGSRPQFDSMLGQTLATGATTFIQVPSDKMMSLAMTTFFPRSYSGKPRTDRHDPQVYYLSEHPRPVYINSEKRMLGESAKADVDVTISVRTVPPPKGVTSEQLPWTLVRVDIKNLTTEVDHHFDYQLDGHSRKYVMHCETQNGTDARVWLVRREDDFRIPYGNVHVVSLIALLRMGLLEETKAKFYDKFLNLPYYEDMAPWNIVFDGGNLTYIDYDSRNVTFNKIAPAAFQVIFMLLNYERTVKDFGKCRQNAKINYGINVVGRCVGSRFHGPCMDNAAPVPCGDGSCRTTYMECLQVLQTLEQDRHERFNTVTENLRKGQIGLMHKESPFDKDTWRFGSDGVISEKNRPKGSI